jgi:transcriptional regulator with XRE-family HTH domain
MNTSPLGDAIRTARIHAGIGLRELAGRVGVTPAYLSDIERGSRVPIEPKVRLIARHLGGNEHEFLQLAVKSRGSVELPVDPSALNTARNEAAFALYRSWPSLTDKEAQDIVALLERRRKTHEP